MEFRAPTVAAQQNAETMSYLTDQLTDPVAARHQVNALFEELGHAVDFYPDWHPLLTLPPRHGAEHVSSLSDLKTYAGMDHTREFVRGFVTCPYSPAAADRLVESVNEVEGLYARRLADPLYADKAHPVVVAAMPVELEADGTIRSRDAIGWFVQQIAAGARRAEVAETWWNVRASILGAPHGSRSSLFVNQYAGAHMRKILEAMNASGMFGPILESSLAMLSPKKRNTIGDTLIRTAIRNWDRESATLEFEMRGETCKAAFRDTWDDGTEYSVRVEIGKYDLFVSGFYEPKGEKVSFTDPQGKRELAEKFL